jgi:hypothetical protein
MEELTYRDNKMKAAVNLLRPVYADESGKNKIGDFVLAGADEENPQLLIREYRIPLKKLPGGFCLCDPIDERKIRHY